MTRVAVTIPYFDFFPHLKDELLGLRMELSECRDSIQDIVGFDDFVRGFDGELVTDENIDFLDIYAQFLG